MSSTPTPTSPPNGAPSARGWAPASSGPPPPRSTTLARRRALPPADAVRPHDEHAAALLEHVRRLEGAEGAAATAYQAAAGWGEALRADRTYVADYLRRHGELPPPDTGPLGDHPRTLEQLYVNAWRCGFWMDIARADLAAYVTTAKRLRESLDVHADALRDRIREEWETARDAKDRRALDRGWDIADEWLAARRLFVWVDNPTADYRPPQGRTFPAELAHLEWEADGAVTGKHRPEVPLEVLQMADAPRPADAPAGLPPRGTGVVGDVVLTPRRSIFNRKR